MFNRPVALLAPRYTSAQIHISPQLNAFYHIDTVYLKSIISILYILSTLILHFFRKILLYFYLMRTIEIIAANAQLAKRRQRQLCARGAAALYCLPRRA